MNLKAYFVKAFYKRHFFFLVIIKSFKSYPLGVVNLLYHSFYYQYFQLCFTQYKLLFMVVCAQQNTCGVPIYTTV